MKIPKGKVAGVTILDHVEGSREPLTFTVYGIIQEVHDEHIVIASWAYADKETRNDDNESIFTLIKSAIQKIEIYT